MSKEAKTKKNHAPLTTRETQELVAAMIKCYPQNYSELKADSLFQFLCCVVLSAQTTDAAVNRVTLKLFERYPDAKAMSQASSTDIEPYIKTIGLYHNKAKFLSGLSRELMQYYDGQVPKERHQLESLPGVGRKTANVVLSAGFGEPAFAVDTHIKRLCRKFHFTTEVANEKQIEETMCAKLPPSIWHQAHHSILLFGRYQCVARKHDHTECLARLDAMRPSSNQELQQIMAGSPDGGHSFLPLA